MVCRLSIPWYRGLSPTGGLAGSPRDGPSDAATGGPGGSPFEEQPRGMTSQQATSTAVLQGSGLIRIICSPHFPVRVMRLARPPRFVDPQKPSDRAREAPQSPSGPRPPPRLGAPPPP